MTKDTSFDAYDWVFIFDLLLTIVVFCVSYWIKIIFFPSSLPLNFYSHLFILPLLLAFISSTLTYFGGYDSPSSTSMIDYSWSIFRSITLSVGLLLALLFFLQIQYLSRFVILLFAVLEIITLLICRGVTLQFFKNQVKSGKNILRVLIVGSHSRATELLSALQKQVVWGISVAGFVDPDPNLIGTKVNGIPVIGTVDNITVFFKPSWMLSFVQITGIPLT